MLSVRVPRHIKPWDKSQGAEEARAELAADMAALNPSGFRQPMTEDGAPGFVEARYIRAGLMDAEELRPPRSKRGQRKARVRAAHRRFVRHQQLLLEEMRVQLAECNGAEADRLAGEALEAARRRGAEVVAEGRAWRLSRKRRRAMRGR